MRKRLCLAVALVAVCLVSGGFEAAATQHEGVRSLGVGRPDLKVAALSQDVERRARREAAMGVRNLKSWRETLGDADLGRLREQRNLTKPFKGLFAQRGTRVRRRGVRVPVREVSLCDFLRQAARHPNRKFSRRFANKKVTFYGHQLWVANLICRWISRAVKVKGKPNPAFLNTMRGYAERQGFLGEVLNAFQTNAGVRTSAIDRQRLRVGDKIFEWRTIQRPGGIVKRRKPKARKMWVIRSIERQDRLLVGLDKQYFTTKGKDPLKWIRDAEAFLIRAFALAAMGREIVQRGDLWPTVEMGRPVEQAVKRFIQTAMLKNTKAKPKLKEYGAATSDRSNRRVLTPRELRKFRGDPRYVELRIARFEVPVPGFDGMNFFEYTAMNSDRRKKWFIKTLATGTGAYEPGGITLPMWRFEARRPRALPMPDVLFDEETRARVQTRFEVIAVCLVRLHYYEVPPGTGATTAQVLAHEVRHYRAIRTAWHRRTQLLRRDLAAFAAVLNRNLGITGAEAFRFQGVTAKEVWLPDKNAPNASSIPIGPLVPSKHQIQFHSFPEVQVLRLRLTREIGADKAGPSLVKMLESGKDFDKRFKDAKKIWAAWWKKNGHKYKIGFVRDILLAALDLDAREGMILETGQQAGRRKLRQVAAELRRKTDPDNKKTANKNPLKELEKLLKKHRIR